MTDRWLLRLSRSGERLTLDAHRDPRGERRALVHAGGYALSHLELAVPPGLAEPLRALTRALPSITPAAPDVMLRAAARSLDGLEVTLVRRLDEAQPLPFWPVTSRRGDPREGEIWPFDAERVALEAGLRALIRREGLDATEAERERAYFEGHGLRTRFLGAPHGTLVAARDQATLDAAAARERANVAAGASWAAAARANGLALGYPPCCVEAFVAIRARDERSLLAECLPAPDGPGSSPLAQWLCGALALISHAPCRADCAPTLALAAAVLEGLGPSFERSWRPLAQRLHAIDLEGRCYALDAGPDGRVREALELTPSDAPTPTLRLDAGLAGARARVEEGVLRVVGERTIESALFADHRG